MKLTTKHDLVEEFELLLRPLMQHVYRMHHQYREIKSKDRLEKNEMLIQVDFSENYVCKYGEESQVGFAFPGSRFPGARESRSFYIPERERERCG